MNEYTATITTKIRYQADGIVSSQEIAERILDRMMATHDEIQEGTLSVPERGAGTDEIAPCLRCGDAVPTGKTCPCGLTQD